MNQRTAEQAEKGETVCPEDLEHLAEQAAHTVVTEIRMTAVAVAGEAQVEAAEQAEAAVAAAADRAFQW